MKTINLIFILTLLISFSIQKNLNIKNQKTENELAEGNESFAEKKVTEENQEENQETQEENQQAQEDNQQAQEDNQQAQEDNQQAQEDNQQDANSEEDLAAIQLRTKETNTELVEELSSMAKDFDKNYFDGHWLMYGYGCNRNTPKEEKCKCHTEGNTFICIKTLGDDCVTTGHETFRGNLPGQLQTGKNVPITYVVGNARRPNSGKWRNGLHIVNDNEFRSQGRRYIRDTKQNDLEKPKPKPAPIDPKPVVEEMYIAPPPRPAPQPANQHMVYYHTNYFLGNWNGIGYICDAKTPQIEVVNIRYQNGRLYAQKLLGDNCVPTKKLSFDGAIPQTLWQGASFPVKFVIGSPEAPASAQVDNTIQIVDINTFKIGHHTYYRVMGPGAAHPHGVYINMTPLIGHSNYPGPGYIKLNPKKNMRSPARRFVIVEEETNKPGNC